MKAILFIIMIVFLGCGVETSSSGSVSSPPNNGIVPPENNETVPPENNETVPPDNNETESDYDMEGAILDDKACGSFEGYTAMKDNSFDPEGFYDSENGITIGSSYPLSFNPSESEVVLFRPDLLETKIGTFTVIYGENYYVSFDQAWVTNVNNIIYVKTPQNADTNDKYGCYRYELDSINNKDINETKVYRLK